MEEDSAFIPLDEATPAVAAQAPQSERSEYYSAWLKIFAELREKAVSLQYTGYYVEKPEAGFVSVAAARAMFSEEQYKRVLDHALCLACLDGNAFPDLIEQYVPEALENLRRNGWGTMEERPARSTLSDGAACASTTNVADNNGMNTESDL